ncbi:MAG: methyltransferase domain-containing protein [Gammaproteobacteria bacterium]|jgi:phospholipid N-methyltransferase|nr:methyltransferase domain-containing protein [Gammaproteobacteria bacterium]
MSLLFLKSFFKRPHQVASVIPSFPMLVERVARQFDFSEPRRIIELGPGEGVHTRALLERLPAGSKLLLIEIDSDLAAHLKAAFADDERVEVVQGEANELAAEMQKRGWEHCDYVLSGIPFSILPADKKKPLIESIYAALKPEPHTAFVIYQVTPELRDHAAMFPRHASDYCLWNLPPMYVIAFFKTP